MIACEALLLVTLLIMLCQTSYTDCRLGIIKNSTLVVCLCAATLLNIIYFIAWARDLLPLFLMNTGLMAALAIMLYAYNLWAAGDSKLLIVATLCIPARLLTPLDIGPFPEFWILAITFILAFLYVVVESAARGFADGKPLRTRPITFDVKSFIARGLIMLSGILIANYALSVLAPQFYLAYPSLTMALNFCIALSLSNIQRQLSQEKSTIVATCLGTALAVMALIGVWTPSLSFSVKSIALVISILLIRFYADRYNYQEILTSSVKAGQILSAQTVMSFTRSRVKGLPTGMTEDMRSRITECEADSVRRWESSAHGAPTVIIVRKVPFAIFISLGTLVFTIAEGALLWR